MKKIAELMNEVRDLLDRNKVTLRDYFWNFYKGYSDDGKFPFGETMGFVVRFPRPNSVNTPHGVGMVVNGIRLMSMMMTSQLFVVDGDWTMTEVGNEADDDVAVAVERYRDELKKFVFKAYKHFLPSKTDDELMKRLKL